MPGQVWGTAAAGGTLTNPVLSEKLRYSSIAVMRFVQLTKVEGRFGPNRGDNVVFKKVGPPDQEGRIHTELEAIQEAKVTFYSDSVTIKEYSLAISFTDRLEELARLNVRSAIIRRLKDDAVKVLDKAAASQFRAADVVYVPTGTTTAPTYTLTTNGSAGAQATRNIQADDVKNLVDTFKSTYSVPSYDAEGNYLLIVNTQAKRGLLDSREIIEDQRHGAPERRFRGEIGMWYGTRYLEETNVLSSNLGSNSNLGESIMIGDDPVMEIVAKALEIQFAMGKWDRDRAIRWVAWLAFKKTWAFSEASQVRIARVYST